MYKGKFRRMYVACGAYFYVSEVSHKQRLNEAKFGRLTTKLPLRQSTGQDTDHQDGLL
jgi:hypothetical protein